MRQNLEGGYLGNVGTDADGHRGPVGETVRSSAVATDEFEPGRGHLSGETVPQVGGGVAVGEDREDVWDRVTFGESDVENVRYLEGDDLAFGVASRLVSLLSSDRGDDL